MSRPCRICRLGAILPAKRPLTHAPPLTLLALIAFGVEAGQLALPGKVADLTDALLEFVGGLLGYSSALWAWPRLAVATNTAPGKPVDRARAASFGMKLLIRPVSSGFPWVGAHVLYLGGLAGALALVLRWAVMPYNVRELVPPGLLGVWALLALVVVFYGMANSVFFLMRERQRVWFLAFPLLLLVQALAAWCLIRVGVPSESLQDVIGTPVLAWPWEWESLGRFAVLYTALGLQVLGAALLVSIVRKKSSLVDFAYWAMLCAMLAWPLHLSVVEHAATDNLTELMAHQASFLASAVISLAFFLTCLAASAISATLAHPGERIWLLLGVAVGSAMGASVLFWVGTEHTIVKYGRMFSAFQFLLSSDREHYAQGTSLLIRFVLAFLLVCVGLATAQWLSWKQWLRTQSQ